MRPIAVLALAAGAVTACAEPYQPTSHAEAAALARCQAQAFAATAGLRDPVQIAVGRLQVQNSCMYAWQMEYSAEVQRVLAEREREEGAQAAATSEADARARAERDCRGARNRDACIQGVVALARAQPASAPAPAASSTRIAPFNRGPATSDRPSYDW